MADNLRRGDFFDSPDLHLLYYTADRVSSKILTVQQSLWLRVNCFAFGVNHRHLFVMDTMTYKKNDIPGSEHLQ